MLLLNRRDFVTCLIFVTFVSGEYYNHSETNNHCVDLKPQTTLDMDQLFGMWNGVEIIQHQHRDHYPQSQKICPVILIADVTPDATPNPYDTYGAGYGYDSVNYGSYQNNQNLRRNRNRAFRKQYWRNMSLLWDEGAFTVEYKLRYDQSKPGLWISSGAHNNDTDWDYYNPQTTTFSPYYSSSSSLLEKRFDSFTGHVQVLKAVGTHLVLTFCHILPQNELFTIILSRSLELNPQDLVSVHNLLGRRHLSTYHVQKVCRNGSEKLIGFSVPLGLVILGIFAIQKYF